MVVYELQIGMTASQLTCFADLTANTSLCVRSYYLITWMSRTAVLPVSTVTLWDVCFVPSFLTHFFVLILQQKTDDGPVAQFMIHI